MEHLKIPINDLRKITVNMYVAKKNYKNISTDSLFRLNNMLRA